VTQDDIMLHKLFSDGRPTVLVLPNYQRAASLRYSDQWGRAANGPQSAANVSLLVTDEPCRLRGLSVRVVGDKASDYQFNLDVRNAIKEWV
jgi:hypothetical protein